MTRDSRFPVLSNPRGDYSISVLDAIFQVLSKENKAQAWPEKSFPQIAVEVSKKIGRQVQQPPIRGMVYRRTDLFERVGERKGSGVRWRLSKKGRDLL